MSQYVSPPDRNAYHLQPDGHLQEQRAPSLIHAPQRCVLARSRILAAIPTPRACPPVRVIGWRSTEGF